MERNQLVTNPAVRPVAQQTSSADSAPGVFDGSDPSPMSSSTVVAESDEDSARSGKRYAKTLRLTSEQLVCRFLA